MPFPPKVAPAVTPVWPLPDVVKRVATYGGKAFGASRKGGIRHHAGVDILAPEGATVVAPENGVLVASQRFNGPRAHALLLQTATGPVILFGEVLPGSWHEFGLDIGSEVTGGAPVARVGVNPGGSTMLHYEMYREGTSRNHRWMQGAPPPQQLLDPTLYLEAAAAGEPIEPVPSVDEHEDEDDEEIPHDPGDADMPNDVEFDPTAEEAVEWTNRTMTPADASRYSDAGYRPHGMWKPEQLVCTQSEGTYQPGSDGPGLGTCYFPNGAVCDSLEYMRGNCSGEPVMPQLDPGEPGKEGSAEEEGWQIDPWKILPGGSKWGIPGGQGEGNGFPWWWLIIGGVVIYAILDD